MSALGTWAKEHPLLTGALACALVSTAHAEYTLATATGVHPWVALAVPGALDLYVIQALRVKRDVATAVLVMVAANVVSHLMVNGLYPAGDRWQVGVTAAVGALAPVLLWRVHALERTRTRSELLFGLPAGAVSAPVPPPPSAQPDAYSEPYPDEVQVLGAPEYVPAGWMEAEYPETHPRPLYSVPPLPDEYVTSAQPLKDSDWASLPSAREYVASAQPPTVKGLMRHAKVGQDRAGRLLDHLEAERTKEES